MEVFFWLFSILTAINAISEEECDYYSNNSYLISFPHLIFDAIIIRNNTLEIQFDIKLNSYCNTSFCNIFDIHNNHYHGDISLSIDGIQNYFQITVSNGFNYNDKYRIPNANTLLPVDNQYHSITLTYTHNRIDDNMIKIDDITYHYSSITSFIISTHETYELYMSNPWTNSTINASVSNVCIKSSVDSTTKLETNLVLICGQQVTDKLPPHPRIDDSYDTINYLFNLTVDSAVSFDSSNSTSHIIVSLLGIYFNYDMDDNINSRSRSKMYVPDLSAGQYTLRVYSSSGLNDTDGRSNYHINIVCNDTFQDVSIYKLSNYLDTDWYSAEKYCEREFGTSLATILTDQDRDYAVNTLSLYGYRAIVSYNYFNTHSNSLNTTLLIGMYNDHIHQNEWQWISHSCNYTSTGNCIDDTHWHPNQPDGEPIAIQQYGAALIITHDGDNLVGGTIIYFVCNCN